MLSNPHFYNRTIRKVVVAFGTMFNDIEVVRFMKDGTPTERFKVPLSYGPKEKYVTRITSDPDLTKSIATTVPRISFNLEGMAYDASRKQITTLKNFGSNNGTFASQYVPVPYDFNFTMSVYVRNIEDGTQILEQILPFFTPDFTVTIDFISSMNQKYDMPVILNSVSSSADYEGDLMNTRLVFWDLDFTAKGYIWPAVRSDSSNGKLIRYAHTSIRDITSNTKLVDMMTSPEPINADITDDYDIIDEITEYFTGKDGTSNPNPLPGSGTLVNSSDPLTLGVLETPYDPGAKTKLTSYSLAPGLYRKKYDGYFADDVLWFKNKLVMHGIADPVLSYQHTQLDDTFSFQWKGYFKPPVTGEYNFWLLSDDASYMWLGQNAYSGYTTANALVQNGSEHSDRWSNNLRSVVLDANYYYPIRIQSGDNGSVESMQLFYGLINNQGVSTGTRNFAGTLYYNTISSGF